MTKTNPRSDQPCPAWCATDHEAEDAGLSCTGPDHDVRSAEGWRVATAKAQLFPGDKTPEIVSYAHGREITGQMGTAYATGQRHAADLAAFVDRLAEMKKPEIRALAGRIREAAAEAWPEAEAG
jgi:hypothetical protein